MATEKEREEQRTFFEKVTHPFKLKLYYSESGTAMIRLLKEDVKELGLEPDSELTGHLLNKEEIEAFVHKGFYDNGAFIVKIEVPKTHKK